MRGIRLGAMKTRDDLKPRNQADESDVFITDE